MEIIKTFSQNFVKVNTPILPKFNCQKLLNKTKMKKKVQKNLSECTKNYMIKKVRKNTKIIGGERYDRNRIGDIGKRCSVE